MRNTINEVYSVVYIKQELEHMSIPLKTKKAET